MATTHYELWDLAAGNLLGAFPSEAAALAEVRAGVAEDGAEAWREVGLRASGDMPSQSERIAAGNELIKLAMDAPGSVPPDKMAEPLDPEARVPNLDIRSRSDVRITSDGRRVVVEIDTQGDDPIIGRPGEVRRRA